MGVVVFWLWWATTSPIQSVPPEAQGSKTTQQGQEAGQHNDAGTISAGPSGFISSCKAEPLQLARPAGVKYTDAAEKVWDGVEDDGAYVSPLGKRLIVSADTGSEAVLQPHSSNVLPHGCMLQVSIKIDSGHSVQDLPHDTRERMHTLLKRICVSHGLPPLAVLSCAARNGCIQLVLELSGAGSGDGLTLTLEQRRQLHASVSGMDVGLLEGPHMLVGAAHEDSSVRSQRLNVSAGLLSIQEDGDLASALQLGALDALGFDNAGSQGTEQEQQASKSADVHAHVMRRSPTAAQEQHSSAATSSAAATLDAAPRFTGPVTACTPVLQHVAGRGTCALLHVPLSLKPGTTLAGFSASLAHGEADSDVTSRTDMSILAHSQGQYLRTVVLPRSAEKGQDVGTFTEFEVGWQSSGLSSYTSHALADRLGGPVLQVDVVWPKGGSVASSVPLVLELWQGTAGCLPSCTCSSVGNAA
jgi:hypothetical protein